MNNEQQDRDERLRDATMRIFPIVDHHFADGGGQHLLLAMALKLRLEDANDRAAGRSSVYEPALREMAEAFERCAATLDLIEEKSIYAPMLTHFDEYA